MIMRDQITTKERLTFGLTAKQVISDILFLVLFMSIFIIGGFYV